MEASQAGGQPHCKSNFILMAFRSLMQFTDRDHLHSLPLHEYDGSRSRPFHALCDSCPYANLSLAQLPILTNCVGQRATSPPYKSNSALFPRTSALLFGVSLPFSLAGKSKSVTLSSLPTPCCSSSPPRLMLPLSIPKQGQCILLCRQLIN